MAQPSPATAFHLNLSETIRFIFQKFVRITGIIRNVGSYSIHWIWSWADVSLEELAAEADNISLPIAPKRSSYPY